MPARCPTLAALSALRTILTNRPCLAGLLYWGGYKKARGFGFEVQLSLTKKGQYAVAYCLS